MWCRLDRRKDFLEHIQLLALEGEKTALPTGYELGNHLLAPYIHLWHFKDYAYLLTQIQTWVSAWKLKSIAKNESAISWLNRNTKPMSQAKREKLLKASPYPSHETIFTETSIFLTRKKQSFSSVPAFRLNGWSTRHSVICFDLLREMRCSSIPLWFVITCLHN